MKYFLLLFMLTLISCANENEQEFYLNISTFNIAWLGDGIDDYKNRSISDYQKIAESFLDLESDIFALQEIENQEALNKLLEHIPNYKSEIIENGNKQNLAFLYTEKIEVLESLLLWELAVEKYKTRPAHLIRFKKANQDYYLINLHFKSTSRYDSTVALKEASYDMRRRQSAALSKIIDSLYAFDKDIIILGDFNDNPNRSNCNIKSLSKRDDLNFLTSNLKSCKFTMLDGIDHIVISNNIDNSAKEADLFVYDLYSKYTNSEAENVSDHCPISLHLEY